MRAGSRGEGKARRAALLRRLRDARVLHAGGIALKAAEIIASAVQREIAAGAGAPVVALAAFEVFAADQAARAVPDDARQGREGLRGGGHAGIIAQRQKARDRSKGSGFERFQACHKS